MPRRWAFRFALLLGLTVLAAPSRGQSGAADKVTYHDRAADGKLVTTSAVTKESPAGVQLIIGDKVKTVVSPADMVRLDPGAVKGVPLGDVLAARALENGPDPAKPRAAFAELLKKAGPTPDAAARRYLAFREAYWAGQVANQKTGAAFKAEAPKAAEKLAAVGQLARKSWEVWPALRSAARLYLELGDYAKAATALSELASVTGLPADLRYEAKLAAAEAQIRAGQGLSAEGLLNQLGADKSFPASGPLRERLTVLTAAAKLPRGEGEKPTAAQLAALEKAVNAAKDPTAKAVGYNFLGDGKRAVGRTRDAMWDYLWVDVVYNQDKDEHLLADQQLVALFERMNDKDRAEQFRDKLPRVR
jgi:hypothetical protein